MKSTNRRQQQFELQREQRPVHLHLENRQELEGNLSMLVVRFNDNSQHVAKFKCR
jgi:hypothetical protein